MTTSRAAQAVSGPPPSIEPRTPDEVAAEVRCSPQKVRRALVDGSLHGHRAQDVPGARWSVAHEVGLLWAAGLDEAAQRDACGLCAVVRRHTPAPRTGGDATVRRLPARGAR